ncbi:MAG: DUF6326 family protein [Bacteroidota bacterium]
MNTDPRLDLLQTKLMISALWTVVLFNMLFRDLHEFARTGFLEELIAMTSNGASISEGLLLGAAAFLQIPITMIALTLVLKTRATWWANLIAAPVTLAMIVGNNLAPDLDDAFFVAVECAALLLVMRVAWRRLRAPADASVLREPTALA